MKGVYVMATEPRHIRIIAIGDNVCDKYLSRGKMYPGGQCVNTCAYVRDRKSVV